MVVAVGLGNIYRCDPGELQGHMSKLADSHKRIVERLAEVIRSRVVVVESERIFRDNVPGISAPDFVDG
jgi:hypothetical protein